MNVYSGTPGSTISSDLGVVTVTDNRALLSAARTATASSTSFTTGGGTANQVIPASNVSYNPGQINTTGTITATGTNITLSGTRKRSSSAPSAWGTTPSSGIRHSW